MCDDFMAILDDGLDGSGDGDDYDSIAVVGPSTPSASSRGSVSTPDVKEPRTKQLRYRQNLEEIRVSAGAAVTCILLERRMKETRVTHVIPFHPSSSATYARQKISGTWIDLSTRSQWLGRAVKETSATCNRDETQSFAVEPQQD